MKIAVIGAGYVGIVTAACLAGMGNEVVCVDKDAAKVKKINAGGAPIYEEGLGELVKAGVKKGRLKATGEISRAKQAEIIFICVGTPTAGDGSADLSHVNAVADGIAKIMSDASRYFVVVVKSTVPPGTTDELAKRIAEKSGKKENSNFGVCMNPEFLREGSAVKDFMNPDRVVIGSRGKKAGEAVRKLFSAFEAPVVMTDAKTAEMIKYASNTFLAARISLINEIGNICKTMGIDVYEVAEGMGYDKRIGKSFLRAGCGFGGSCLPKDVKALTHEARKKGYEPKLLEAVMKLNEKQPLMLVDLAERKIGVKGKTFALLGLAFKPDCDDVRESSALTVARELAARGANVIAYDPQAMGNAKKAMEKEGIRIKYAKSAKEAVDEADAVLIVTEWGEFANPKLYIGKPVFDGRNVFNGRIPKFLDYEGICW